MATTVIMPKQGNTVEECVLVSWKVAEGDSVTEGQVIAEAETDKAVFDLESTAEGTILSILKEEGDTVPILENVAVIGSPGEDISQFVNSANDSTNEQQVTKKTSEPPQVKDIAEKDGVTLVQDVIDILQTNQGISPRARNYASSKNLDIASMKGTGPGGRIIERDVIEALQSNAPMTSLAQEIVQDTGLKAPTSGTGIGGRIIANDLISDLAEEIKETPQLEAYIQKEDEEITLSGVRKIVADRMLESLRNTAQLTFNISANATTILNYRARLKAKAETLGLPSVTIGDMIMFAVGRVLRKFPNFNATLTGDIYKKYCAINLAFACDTPRGLLVPVIADAGELSLEKLSLSIKEKANQAKSGKIDPDSLQGGTFTVSNLGIMGITDFTPVLNYPQVGILGVNAIELKSIRVAGKVEHIDCIGFSLTINHQVIDGWQAGLFLKELCLSIENFDLLLTR